MHSIEEDYINPVLNVAGLSKAIGGVVQSDKLVSDTGSSQSSEESNWIYIGGLFELSEREGESALSAAKMAIEDVNRQQIVKGFKLKLVWNDTQVSLYNLM